jgi:hypothetical protein
MGSMWDAHRSQLARFQIAAEGPDGAVTFIGGHPRKSDHRGAKTGAGFFDGTGRYIQSAQTGATYVAMARVPEDDELDYAYFLLPAGAEPKRAGDWFVVTVGKTVVAVRPIAGRAELTEIDAGKKLGTLRALKFPGRRTGFIVEAADDTTTPAAADLVRALAKTRLDAAGLAKDPMTLSYTNVRGRTISMAFDPDPTGDEHGSRAAKVRLDGTPVDLASWPIYSGPFVEQRPGVLTVNDGREGYTIDFTGDLPKYKRWRRK